MPAAPRSFSSVRSRFPIGTGACLVDLQSPVLRAPSIERGFANPGPPAQILHRNSRLGIIHPPTWSSLNQLFFNGASPLVVLWFGASIMTCAESGSRSIGKVGTATDLLSYRMTSQDRIYFDQHRSSHYARDVAMQPSLLVPQTR
jgi:hypothetical protein